MVEPIRSLYESAGMKGCWNIADARMKGHSTGKEYASYNAACEMKGSNKCHLMFCASNRFPGKGNIHKRLRRTREEPPMSSE